MMLTSSESINPLHATRSRSGVEPLSVVGKTIARISKTGRITQTDKNCLLQATRSQHMLTDDETQQIRIVFDRLQRGFLTIVDE